MGRTIRYVVFIGGTVFVLAAGGYALFSMITGDQKSSETPIPVSGTSQEQDKDERNLQREIYQGFVQFWTGYRDALIERDLERTMALIDSSDHAFYGMRRTANLKAIEQADSIKVFHSGG